MVDRQHSFRATAGRYDPLPPLPQTRSQVGRRAAHWLVRSPRVDTLEAPEPAMEVELYAKSLMELGEYAHAAAVLSKPNHRCDHRGAPFVHPVALWDLLEGICRVYGWGTS